MKDEYYDFFSYMSEQHGLTLTNDEMYCIMLEALKLKEKLTVDAKNATTYKQ